MRPIAASFAAIALAAVCIGAPAHAQMATAMDHASHAAAPTTPALAGQAAYAALAAIVATLEADPTTDWSKVNMEALRQHLIVMNDVIMGARTLQSNVAGGARMDVTGDGRVAESIRTMLHAHARMMDGMGAYRTTVDDIPGGARFTVTASDSRDEKTTARIRALGFSGLLTLGDHHAQHHLALARGQAMTHQ